MAKTKCNSKASLLKILEIDAEYKDNSFPSLLKIINNLDDYYLSYPIKKADKRKLRWIDAPLGELKELQYKILYKFLYNFNTHPAAVGFKIGTSVKESANTHLGNKVILTMDITNFFNSIKMPMVFRLVAALSNRLLDKNNIDRKKLTDADHNKLHAETHIITHLLCFKGQVPQGAPTSPALANLIARRLDTVLAKYSEDQGMTYTRYADDLTFSHPDKTYDIGKNIKIVEKVIKEAQLQTNYKKTRILRPHRRMLVTGVVINEKLGVPKYKWRNLRARIHNIKKGGSSISLKEYQQIRGYCEWVRNLNPSRGAQLIQELGKIPLLNS